jgi:hypothetical protein
LNDDKEVCTLRVHVVLVQWIEVARSVPANLGLLCSYRAPMKLSPLLA